MVSDLSTHASRVVKTRVGGHRSEKLKLQKVGPQRQENPLGRRPDCVVRNALCARGGAEGEGEERAPFVPQRRSDVAVCRVQGSGGRVQGSRFRVQGSGCSACG